MMFQIDFLIKKQLLTSKLTFVKGLLVTVFTGVLLMKYYDK